MLVYTEPNAVLRRGQAFCEKCEMGHRWKSGRGETEADGETVADGVARDAEGAPKLKVISFLVK